MHTRVTSRDGTTLAVSERGDPNAPTVVCVHGYPDNRSMWGGVADRLVERFHVVTYDVRGAGESDRPRGRNAYHLDRLSEDLTAVLDAVSPEKPVHLLAHDWGSIQSWHTVTSPESADRFASFTSISGPCLDHAGQWMRSSLRPHPRALRDLGKQLACSGYTLFFQLPLLPELVWRTGLLGKWLGLLEPANPEPELADALHGLNLYRANMTGRLSRPRERFTRIPVQVLAPRGDPFVGTPMQTEIEQWVPDLSVRRITGSHWVPRSNPEAVARCATELIDRVDNGSDARGLRRGKVGVPSGRRFEDQLVVISGAGGGIGRATALAFAEAGAQLVVTDIDGDSAARTAELARERGAVADASAVDVGDGAAVESLAERIEAEHGSPDVVINNAGIGLAGPFAETTDDDWQQVLDVNLRGVIHGCRSFADRMARRGEGGRIVNIASAAAYLHPQPLTAYATSKSAVLTLSHCLRAELAGKGIGVVAVCPGIVRTGITGSTRFVGVDSTEQDRRRRGASELYRRRGFTAERAAQEILRAVERNTAIAPITAEAKAGLVLSRFAPGLLRAAARLGAAHR
ncbi:SDR family oxidoreductase [Parasphingorhabdus pacifica]